MFIILKAVNKHVNIPYFFILGEAESSKDRNEEGEEEGVASDMEGKKGPELKEDEVNLRTHVIAGKIFHFELLTMPPETKLAGTWKIRQGI